MATKFYESDYEEAFIELLKKTGWIYTYGELIHRKLNEVLLEKDLYEYLDKNYSSVCFTVNEKNAIFANIHNVSDVTHYKSLHSAFCLYRDGFNFHRHDIDEDVYVNYINFEEPEKNIFRCVNQFTVSYNSGKYERRPDVLLFINGIPVCIIELKNPVDYNATITDAYYQIHSRYMRDIPHLLKYTVLSCISDGSNSRLGTTYTPYQHYYAWKKVNNDDNAANNIHELETLINGAFAPERCLELLRDFVYFPDLKFGKEQEVVCRYPQFFATNKLLAHIKTHIRSAGGDGKGGTYFGATGCGKTFTMIFLARQLALRANIGSPTIIVIVDREDLQKQSGELFQNSSDFLCNGEIRVIETRTDLSDELSARQSGGVYICTIQKFCEDIGLLSDRSNIICFSDEAHRTQTNTGVEVKANYGNAKKGISFDGEVTREIETASLSSTSDNTSKVGVFISYGFAKFLRDAFPNATYVGFTGTPIDETIHVFGDVVDSYTMRQSVLDGITVPIKYEPRLARINIDNKKASEIDAYYKKCSDEGASDIDIQKSKNAMSSLEVLLGDDSRLERLAKDIVQHYETLVADKADIVQKAMIVCSNRNIAFKLYKKIETERPEWFIAKKSMNKNLCKEELEKLVDLPMINIVATRGKDDVAEMYETLGDKTHRQMLDEQFKNENSNFHIAIVVDMWITGFDVPCLSVMYNDKPLQKHTLIQTISRVNRKYDGKEFGLIVDYIGIHENMKAALKQYDSADDIGTTEDEIKKSKEVFDVELQTIKDLLYNCDLSLFFGDNSLVRLQMLQKGAEFVLGQVMFQDKKGRTTQLKTVFSGHVRRLRAAYILLHPAGVLTDDDTRFAQLYMGIYSYINKMIAGPHDTESMNRHVEQMVKEALLCGDVETLFNVQTEEELFSPEFLKTLENVKLPNTKFQLLVKALKKAIKEYKHTNKIAAEKFEKMLQDTVLEYNTRDNFTFTNNVARDTINNIQAVIDSKVRTLNTKLIAILTGLNADKIEFKKLGITFEEKAFFDILIDVRNRNQFEYSDEKCKALCIKIKELIDTNAVYADWLNNDNVKDELSYNLANLLYTEGYPPTWSNEVFDKVLEQVENFKNYATVTPMIYNMGNHTGEMIAASPDAK